MELNMKPKFELGQVVMTIGVHTNYKEDGPFAMFVNRSLGRYTQCDWGDTCEEDAEQNDISVAQGERILAVYKHVSGKTIWIITEWDRSVTTILFPSEY